MANFTRLNDTWSVQFGSAMLVFDHHGCEISGFDGRMSSQSALALFRELSATLPEIEALLQEPSKSETLPVFQEDR